MHTASPRLRRPPARRRGRRGVLWTILVVVAVVVAGFVAAALNWSGASLARDSAALARVQTQTFGGTVESVRAVGPNGRRIPLVVARNRLTPRTQLTPGEAVHVTVTIRRPGWLGWALGSTHVLTRTFRAPVAVLSQPVLTVGTGTTLRVRFDRRVHIVAYGPGTHLTNELAAHARRAIVLPRKGAAGSLVVAVAARSWETLGPTQTLYWFPPAQLPVALASPAPGAHLSPLAPIRLTLSKPVSAVFGHSLPELSPAVPGKWVVEDEHTLLFQPSGLGAPLASDVHVTLPKQVAVTGGTGNSMHPTSRIDYTVPPASFLRLQQLLAQAGYLPVDWTPAGTGGARTMTGELAAAINPPAGSFSWRYPNTPAELQAQWTPGQASQITRGAVMMFEHDHNVPVDGIAGPQVWHLLFTDSIAGKRSDSGYSYVFVHRDLPQLLTLWHNGNVILTSPGNTGVPQAPTQLGTFPVFEHIPVGTMSGTNPNGSRYNDPGIKWISYFNHGEALHAFPRASFGTPQSLGCVELPLAAAAQVWPYTPIGTLVTIEH
jgi:hypothetical protein